MSTEQSAQALAAGITSITMALVGLPHLALLWGFIGALVGIVFTAPESKQRMLAVVCASGFVGAASGFWFSRWSGGGDPALFIACLIVGAGAKPLLSKAIAAVAARIEQAGGKS